MNRIIVLILVILVTGCTKAVRNKAVSYKHGSLHNSYYLICHVPKDSMEVNILNYEEVARHFFYGIPETNMNIFFWFGKNDSMDYVYGQCSWQIINSYGTKELPFVVDKKRR